MNTVGFTRRTLAGSIDGFVSLGVVAMLFAVGVFDPVIFSPEPGWFLPEWLLKHWLDAPELFVRPVLAWWAIWVAWIGAWGLAVGRTPGDRAARIEVVDAGGDVPHPGRIGLRVVGLSLNAATLGFGSLLGIVVPSQRTLQDLLSGTYAVKYD